MSLTIRVELVAEATEDVVKYLGADLLRNAFDIWNLKFDREWQEFYVCRDGDSIKAHISIFSAPEANYVSIGSVDRTAVTPLIAYLPVKGVVLMEPAIYGLIKDKISPTAVYPCDIMIVKRGGEDLPKTDQAFQLTPGDALDYSRFGTSFNLSEVPVEWAEERIRKDIIFGIRAGSRLASVASVIARLPEMAVVSGVETKEEFRMKGLGAMVSCAATREGLRRSEACVLWVRSNNLGAVRLYQRLGYRKVGDELLVDIGTGMVP
jgi:ribosomal protein S18 acetylase RimI-like enzyme